jgi:Cytochrome oxidase complex assembly protein 1
VHFVCKRPSKFAKWEVEEWSVTSFATGEKVSLLEEGHEVVIEDESS